MKKIKIYLVTYQRENILNDSLDKLFSSDFKNHDNTEVNIINNHTNCGIKSGIVICGIPVLSAAIEG